METYTSWELKVLNRNITQCFTILSLKGRNITVVELNLRKEFLVWLLTGIQLFNCHFTPIFQCGMIYFPICTLTKERLWAKIICQRLQFIYCEGRGSNRFKFYNPRSGYCRVSALVSGVPWIVLLAELKSHRSGIKMKQNYKVLIEVQIYTINTITWTKTDEWSSGCTLRIGHLWNISIWTFEADIRNI